MIREVRTAKGNTFGSANGKVFIYIFPFAEPIRMEKGLSIPEFSANTLAKVVRPCRALVVVP